MAINSNITFPDAINFCKYNVRLIFSAFDVLTGEEVTVDKIIFDGVEIPDIESKCRVDEDVRHIYTIDGQVLKNCQIELIKEYYFPYVRKISVECRFGI